MSDSEGTETGAVVEGLAEALEAVAGVFRRVGEVVAEAVAQVREFFEHVRLLAEEILVGLDAEFALMEDARVWHRQTGRYLGKVGRLTASRAEVVVPAGEIGRVAGGPSGT